MTAPESQAHVRQVVRTQLIDPSYCRELARHSRRSSSWRADSAGGSTLPPQERRVSIAVLESGERSREAFLEDEVERRDRVYLPYHHRHPRGKSIEQAIS